LLQEREQAISDGSDFEITDALGLQILIHQAITVCGSYRNVVEPLAQAGCLALLVEELDGIYRNSIFERLARFELLTRGGITLSVWDTFSEILDQTEMYRKVAEAQVENGDDDLPDFGDDAPADPNLRKEIRSLMYQTVPLSVEVGRLSSLYQNDNDLVLQEVRRIAGETLDGLEVLRNNLSEASRVRSYMGQIGNLSSASQFIAPLASAQLTTFSKDVEAPGLDKRIFQVASRVGQLAGWPNPNPNSIDTPKQILAPFQFELSENRLSVIDQSRTPKDRSAQAVAAALRVLTALGEDIEDDLANSNVSHRVKRAFDRTYAALKDEDGIIVIALLNETFGSQLQAAEPELSDSLFALMKSFSNQVASFVAQFEEWQRYADNNAETQFSLSATATIAHNARAMATAFDSEKDVDPGVSDALRTAAEWVEDPNIPRARAGGSWTVLNVFAAVIGKLVETAKDKSAEIVLTSLVTTVLTHAISSAAIYGATPQGAWLLPAIDYVQKILLP